MKAIPQYNKGYFNIRAQVDVGLEQNPGLFLGGNYVCGVAFGSCVEWGVDTAPKVPDNSHKTPFRRLRRSMRAHWLAHAFTCFHHP